MAWDNQLITGRELRKHPDLYKIRQPKSAPVVSADEYRDQHPELIDRRPSIWGQRKIERAVDTFLAVRPQFRGDSDSATKLIEAVKASVQPISVQLLDVLFQKLVSEGTIKSNPNSNATSATSHLRSIHHQNLVS